MYYNHLPSFEGENWCGFQVATNSVVDEDHHYFSIPIEADCLHLSTAVSHFCEHTFQSETTKLVTTKGKKVTVVLSEDHRFEMKSAPANLQVYVKRYADNDVKRNNAVQFEPILRLRIDGSIHAYTLVAISCHYGETRLGGHYKTFKRESSGLWSCYNDDNRSSVLLEEVLRQTQEVCICFYEKMDPVAAVEFLPPALLSSFRDKQSAACQHLQQFLDNASGDYRMPWMHLRLISGRGQQRWLNDKLIDAAGEILNSMSAPTDPYTKSVYMITTSFAQKIQRPRGVRDTRNWFRNRKISFQHLTKLLIPVNYHDNHWVLLVIDVPAMTIHIFDSMYTSEFSVSNDCKDLKAAWSSYYNDECERQNIPVPDTQ